jgi:branched-chain amino acid transport system permease protein
LATFLVALENGLAVAAQLFLISTGLTLVYGVMRVVNFAHGGFFMLGAYVTFTIGHTLVTGNHTFSVPAFLLSLIVAGVAVSVGGVFSEIALFRRLYEMPELNSLLGTFALLLVIEGFAYIVWGAPSVSLPQPDTFSNLLLIGPVPVPAYDAFVVGIGLTMLVALEWLVQRTGFGMMVKAVAADRTMAALLGVNIRRVFLVMFVIGIFLAGIAGGIAAPGVSIGPDLAASYIIQAFAVVIVGGLGSISGAFLASVLLGVINSVLVAVGSPLAEFSLYLVMVCVLIVRPAGLLGRRSVL